MFYLHINSLKLGPFGNKKMFNRKQLLCMLFMLVLFTD